LAPKITTARPAQEEPAEHGGQRPAPASPAANVVVLAEDAALLELLKEALDARQRIWRADDAVHAADLLVVAQSGVFFVDAALTGRETPVLIDQLQSQFPELPIVVAGRREDELELGQRISSGAVFRFLHKPVSADRIRNFVDAAARRAGDRSRPEASKPEVTTPEEPARARAPRPAHARRIAAWAGRAAGLLLLAALAAAAVVALVQQRPWERLSLPWRSAATATPASTSATATPVPREQAELARLLAAAGIALSQGRLAEPEGENAIELYKAILLRDPGNAAAHAGLGRIAEELLLKVERSLVAEDLVGAASALDAARSADPANPRLDFFSTQLQHERDRIMGLSRRAPADSAAAADTALSEQVSRLLAQAQARMKDGRLTGGTDAADAYVTAARGLRPEDPGVQQALNALSWRMMLAASEAIDAGDPDEAAGWLDRADALGVDGRAVARLRAEMESARVATVQEDRSRLLALANQRIAQGQLIEPAADSASHYVDLLRASAPGYDGLAETRALLVSRLLEAAGRQARDGHYQESDRLLAAAEAAGAGQRELSAARYHLEASRALAAAAAEVLPENALQRTVYQPAEYPGDAQARGLEGWVEVEFTVAADGSTRDAIVKAASPEGVFDAAVIRAVAAWRYQPRIVAGKAVDQRVQARVRFRMPER
jgi:protein TonB